MLQIWNFQKNFGLDKYLIQKCQQITPKNIGDAYKAFIAAVYLVYGADKATQIVTDLVSTKFDSNNTTISCIKSIVNSNSKPKRKLNKVLEKLKIKDYYFDTIKQEKVNDGILLTRALYINGEIACTGQGFTARKADKIVSNTYLNSLIKNSH